MCEFFEFYNSLNPSLKKREVGALLPLFVKERAGVSCSLRGERSNVPGKFLNRRIK